MISRSLIHKTAIVTGASSGLGRECATQLAAAGANVVLACRDDTQGKEIANHLGARASYIPLDLARLDSIEAFAKQITSQYQRIDLLINCAGVMFLPECQHTVDGFERTLAVNCLGPFALICHLCPLLVNQPHSRIVNVASSASERCHRIDFDNLHAEKSYHKWPVYARSKLCLLMMSLELDQQLISMGAKTRSIAASPGFVPTPLFRHQKFIGYFASIIGHSVQQGVKPILQAALDDPPPSTGYISVGGLMQLRGPPKSIQPNPLALDTHLRREVWDACERYTGCHLPSNSV